MKKTFNVILSIILIMLFTVTSVGFTSTPVKSIKVNNSKITMKVGQTFTIKVTITPSNASDKGLLFSSNNKKIAAVDKNGKITAVKAGNAVITVTSSSNKKISAKCNVTVSRIMQTGSSFPLKERIKVKYMHLDFGIKDYNNNAIMDEYTKRTNVEIEHILVPGADLTSKYEVTFASGELPDVLTIPNATAVCEKYADSGLLADMTPMLNDGKLPNITKWMEKLPDLKTLTFAGKMVALPAMNNGATVSQVWFYRDDILKKYGLTIPKTLDEFYNAGKKIKEKDPDMYMFAGRNDLLSIWTCLYGLSQGYYVDPDDMKMKYGPATNKWKDMVAFLTKCYKSGILDPNLTYDFATWQQRFTNGKFVAAEQAFNASNYALIDDGKKLDSNFSMEAELPPEIAPGKPGKVPFNYSVAVSWGNAVSAKSKYAEQLVRLLDYQLSDEMIELNSWGIEGITFVKDGDKKKFKSDLKLSNNPGGTVDPAKIGLTYRTGIWMPIDLSAWFSSQYSERGMKLQEKLNQNYKKIANFKGPEFYIKFTGTDLDERAKAFTDMNDYVTTETFKFITGKLNMSKDWDKFQKQLVALGSETWLKKYDEKYQQLPEDKKKMKTEAYYTDK